MTTYLAEIESRLKAATEGEWKIFHAQQAYEEIYEVGYMHGFARIAGDNAQANAAFIAHAPEDIDYLLSLVEQWKDKHRELDLWATDEIRHLKAQLSTARLEAFEEAANWLRRNANAEKNPDKRAAFIEAHNAIRVLSDTEDRARPTGSEMDALKAQLAAATKRAETAEAQCAVMRHNLEVIVKDLEQAAVIRARVYLDDMTRAYKRIALSIRQVLLSGAQMLEKSENKTS